MKTRLVLAPMCVPCLMERGVVQFASTHCAEHQTDLCDEHLIPHLADDDETP